MTAAGAPGGQATAAGDLPQPNPSDDAVGLARAILPTVHHLRIEYNLSVLDVQRYWHYRFLSFAIYDQFICTIQFAQDMEIV